MHEASIDLLAQLRFPTAEKVGWRERLNDGPVSHAGSTALWDDFADYVGRGDALIFELVLDEHSACSLWPARIHSGEIVRVGAPLTSRRWLSAGDCHLLEWLWQTDLAVRGDGSIVAPPAHVLADLAAANRLYWRHVVLGYNGVAAPFVGTITAECSGGWRVWGSLGSWDLWDVSALLPGALFIADGTLQRCADAELLPLMAVLKNGGAIELPPGELGDFIALIERRFKWRGWELPCHVDIERRELSGTAVLYLHAKGRLTIEEALLQRQRPLAGFVTFRYAGKEYPVEKYVDSAASEWQQDLAGQAQHRDPDPVDYSQEEQDGRVRLVLSYPNVAWEQAQLSTLLQRAGVRRAPLQPGLRLDTGPLLDTIYTLLRGSWEVWAEKVRLTELTDLTVEVSSDHDWFDVGIREPGKDRISTWQLIHFLKRKSLFIRLDDGRLGVLPEEWFHRLRQLLGLGCQEDDRWLFAAGHALSLDNLRQALGPQHCEIDARLTHIVDTLRNLSGLTPHPAPAGFNVTLRSYQEYGLAWLLFMDALGIGGCLADDMGLGKTIQLLAFFATAKVLGRLDKGSLLIAPKSLLEQWHQEAQHAAPHLNVAIVHRQTLPDLARLARTHDLLFASYGLVRHQTAAFAAVPFHYVVLDEAQNIKNAGSKISSAVKALRSARRLAMSGTPIENNVAELLSIFAFLEPGLVSGALEQPEAVVQALRPLVLRRLKGDVLNDLPDKTETAVSLAMSAEQRNAYERVRRYYCEQLLQHEPKSDLEPLKLFFLEGLLRLRQIACDASLVDETLAVSNKVTYLREQIEVLVRGGHKVVVFSQFVKFLRVIRQTLAAVGIRHAYLDGQTRERDKVVKSFQEDPAVQVLLVSLKTGGVGLNLTAGDYCFIMDPWWNSAVEQQAIDRLYRIGQHRHVFVYKVVSRDSIEEKMHKLQEAKRQTAELLTTTEQTFLDSLSYADFRQLFQIEDIA